MRVIMVNVLLVRLLMTVMVIVIVIEISDNNVRLVVDNTANR